MNIPIYVKVHMEDLPKENNNKFNLKDPTMYSIAEPISRDINICGLITEIDTGPVIYDSVEQTYSLNNMPINDDLFKNYYLYKILPIIGGNPRKVFIYPTYKCMYIHQINPIVNDPLIEYVVLNDQLNEIINTGKLQYENSVYSINNNNVNINNVYTKINVPISLSPNYYVKVNIHKLPNNKPLYEIYNNTILNNGILYVENNKSMMNNKQININHLYKKTFDSIQLQTDDNISDADIPYADISASEMKHIIKEKKRIADDLSQSDTNQTKMKRTPTPTAYQRLQEGELTTSDKGIGLTFVVAAALAVVIPLAILLKGGGIKTLRKKQHYIKTMKKKHITKTKKNK